MNNPNRIKIRIFDGSSKIIEIKASDWGKAFKKLEAFINKKFKNV